MRSPEFYQGHLDAVSRSFALCIPQVDAFNASFPDNISDSERALLADTGTFLEDAYDLPAAARGVMFSAIDRMALGMAAYARRPATRLVDLEDVSRYCCIVAGMVGEMLTRLWTLEGQPGPRMLFAYRF